MALTLRDECVQFSRYLTGLEPSEYVVRKYAAYHEERPSVILAFDRMLVNTASSLAMLWLADAYCTRFRKRAELRRRLVLTLALLECSPQTADYLDSPSLPNQAALVIGLGLKGAASIAASLLSLAVFEPVRIFYGLRHGGRSPE